MTKTAKKAFKFDFGGPVGAGVTTLTLPVVVLLLAHWAHVGNVDFTFLEDVTIGRLFWDSVRQSPVLCPGCSEGLARDSILFKTTISLVAWFFFQVFLCYVLPCEMIEGVPIQQHPEKVRLSYRINGHLAFWVTGLIAVTGWPSWDSDSGTVQLGSFPFWSALYEYFGELALAATALCFIVSIKLYINSYRPDIQGNARILAEGGDSGYFVYDFFMGRELNPRVGSSFDWKEFCELRPGLIGWVIMNVAAAHKQHFEQGYVSGSMILVNIFHGIYVWDGLYQEKAILTTMDITTDGFGFMLLFGDLVWVPFTYSLQARYLVYHDPGLSWQALLAILGVHALGYTIFRGANGQKDAFRRNPDAPEVAHLNFLQTQRGTKLLTSGWWGMARKINYTGDYIMGLSWCLVCGFDSVVPYYYAVYFFVLLVHRSIRDDHLCQHKYGDDWAIYKQLVPYRFVPGVA